MKNQSIDITKGPDVVSSSKGKITGTTWTPQPGLDRKQAIEAARAEEMEAYRQRQLMNDPREIRLLAMEGAIADLQGRVVELSKKYEELKSSQS